MWFIKTFMSIGSICGTFQLVIRIVIFALNAIQAMFHFCKCSAHLQHTTQISLGCQSCVFLWVNNCKPTTAVHLIDFQSKETTTMRNEFAGIKKKNQITKPVIVRQFFISSKTKIFTNSLFFVCFSKLNSQFHFNLLSGWRWISFNGIRVAS